MPSLQSKLFQARESKIKGTLDMKPALKGNNIGFGTRIGTFRQFIYSLNQVMQVYYEAYYFSTG